MKVKKILPLVGTLTALSAVVPLVTSCGTNGEKVAIDPLSSFSTKGWDVYKLPQDKEQLSYSEATIEFGKAIEKNNEIFFRDIMWGAKHTVELMKDGLPLWSVKEFNYELSNFKCHSDNYLPLYDLTLEFNISVDVKNSTDDEISYSLLSNGKIDLKSYPINFRPNLLDTNDDPTLGEFYILPLFGEDAIEFFMSHNASSYSMDLDCTVVRKQKDEKIERTENFNFTQSSSNPTVDTIFEEWYDDDTIQFIMIWIILKIPSYYFNTTTII